MCSLEKRGNVFLLKFTGDGDEHCLNETLISSIRSALCDAKSMSTPGSVLITVAQGKYFCNGFDLEPSALASRSKVVHMLEIFKPLIADFISLPMPTIAIITGHAVTAGVILAVSHDYVFMPRDCGTLYMCEIDLGVSLPDYAVELIKSKVVKPKYSRDLLLRALKVKAEEVVAIGLVDKAYDTRQIAMENGFRFAEDLAHKKWDGQVYVEIRKCLYPDLCKMLGLSLKNIVVKARL